MLGVRGGPRLRGAGARRRPGGTRTRAAGGLVVANHVSWPDIPLVAAVFPGRMPAKSDIRHWPLLGPLTALGGTLFVERERLRALPAGCRAPAGATAFVGDDPLAASLWRVVRAAGLTAGIHVMPQIPAGSVHGRRALAGPAQSTVASDRANLPAESVHH